MLLDLPQEILVKILNNLTLFESKNLLLICRTFNEIMNSKKYKKIKLQLYDLINPTKSYSAKNKNYIEIHNNLINPTKPYSVKNWIKILNSNQVEFHLNDSRMDSINLLTNRKKNDNDIYFYTINCGLYNKKIININEFIKSESIFTLLYGSIQIKDKLYLNKFEFYYMIQQSCELVNFINETINL